MIATRRAFFGFASAALAAPALAASSCAPPPVSIAAGNAPPRTRAAMDRLAAYAAAELAAFGFPGMALAFRAPDGSAATAAIGYAQPERQAPVRPAQLFQIGSISKSFVALALLRLADQGRIDLDQPLLKLAPDFPIEDARVTTAHILNHAAGFPGNTPPFAEANRGKLWSATDPGQRFSYSNSGYDLLGLLLERLTGQPFDASLARLTLQPLGMTGSEAVIRTTDRDRFVRGYLPIHRPWWPGDPLAEGPWLDIGRAAGSVASTAPDMARYIAFLAACAAGRPQPLLSAASARRFTTALIDSADFGPQARYGMGLATILIDDKPAIHHTGGMVTFSSAMTLDPANGGGGFASVNIGYHVNYRPRAVTAYAVRLARALAAGAPLPDAPLPEPAAPMPDAAVFAGRYLGPDDLVLEFTPAPAGLALRINGQPARVKAFAPDLFGADHPRLATHALQFEDKGARLWHGADLFARNAAPDQLRPPARLLALAGVYRSNDPWAGEVAVVARGDKLVIEGGGEITEHADGSWRYADPEAVTERVWFGPRVNGRAQTVSLSGERYIRATG